MNMHQSPDLLSAASTYVDPELSGAGESAPGADAPPDNRLSPATSVAPACEHCGEPFDPRAHTGGKAQRFCSPEHRAEYHAQRRQHKSPHVGAGEQSAPEIADADKDAPTPSQLREMLINAGKEYDAKFPPSSIERSIDRVLADMAGETAQESEGFDWQAECVVVPEQRRTAAYFNPAGDFVIRQEAGWNDTEDSIVIIAKANLDGFIDKLTDALGIPSAGH